MNLEEILQQVDEIELMAAEGNFSAAALFPLGFSKVMRSLVERVKEAEMIIEQYSDPSDYDAGDNAKAYLEKWR